MTETDLGALNSAVDVFIDMGIRHFDFIGGEVSKFGDGWLEVVRHIRSRSNAIVTLFTSGWWLGKQDFQAAGSTYRSDKQYLSALHESGLTHILFSIDGLREAHDRCRRLPGLFDRMLAGFAAVRNAGLEPRVSVLVGTGIDVSEYFELLDELAQKIYSFPPGTKKGSRIERITSDPLNIFSNLINIGNQASAKRYGNFDFHVVPDELLYCKGFYRPSPFLTIKANGEVATCRLANAGEGYGNIHKERLVQILNRMQSSFVYQLHAEHEVGRYRRLMDTEVFGEYFDHICTVRAILTLLARRIHETGINPDSRIALHRINLEVAQTTGHAKKGLLKKSSQIRE